MAAALVRGSHAAAAAARPSLLGAHHAGAARAFSSTPAQAATLRELESRIKSVSNIGKITKSMKMVASSRLARAQRAMGSAQSYGATNDILFQQAETAKVDESSSADQEKVLYIAATSDRGLCGGIHSAVSKTARREIAQAIEQGKDVQVVCLGDKPKAQLSRAIPDKLVLTFNQIGRSVPTMADALAIADKIEADGIKFDKARIVYNKFVSAISYDTVFLDVYSTDKLAASPNFAAYEVDDEQMTKDLSSFALANAIYAALVEGHAAEISARRNAMDNASKNATEMINTLQMQFNRMRQAAITNELVDIITGASAL